MTPEPTSGEVAPEWSVLVDSPETAGESASHTIAADPETTAALARRFGVEGLRDVRADLKMTRLEEGDVIIRGRISGHVTQVCVVTLEPFEAALEQDVERLFRPASRTGPDRGRNTGPVDFDPYGDDAPDPFSEDGIDIADFAAEEFALAIDPFPRKPGAVFDWKDTADTDTGETEKPHPFAALERLKTPGSE